MQAEEAVQEAGEVAEGFPVGTDLAAPLVVFPGCQHIPAQNVAAGDKGIVAAGTGGIHFPPLSIRGNCLISADTGIADGRLYESLEQAVVLRLLHGGI